MLMNMDINKNMMQDADDIDGHRYQQGHGGDECGKKNNLLTLGICRRSIQVS